MKVRCKRIFSVRPSKIDLGNQTEDLTVGKEYVVLSVYMGSYISYRIETDCGDLIILEADQFEMISRYIPSNWEIIVNSEPGKPYYLRLSPRNWNNAPFDFYEEITEVSWPLHEWRQYEKIPEVVSLYFQERDLIYREEEEYEKRNSHA